MEKYTLDSKIKELVTKQLLAQPQADLHHEDQFLGNEDMLREGSEQTEPANAGR